MMQPRHMFRALTVSVSKTRGVGPLIHVSIPIPTASAASRRSLLPHTVIVYLLIVTAVGARDSRVTAL